MANRICIALQSKTVLQIAECRHGHFLSAFFHRIESETRKVDQDAGNYYLQPRKNNVHNFILMCPACTHFTASSAESSANLQKKIEIFKGRCGETGDKKSSRQRELSSLLC